MVLKEILFKVKFGLKTVILFCFLFFVFPTLEGLSILYFHASFPKVIGLD